jgi:hypothetical protein
MFEEAKKVLRGVEVRLYSSFDLGARWGMEGRRQAPAATPPETNSVLITQVSG